MLKKARHIAQLLEAAGASDCLMVGGTVRDHLMGIPYKDIDIEVAGNHGLDKSLSYTAKLDVPAKYLGNDANNLLAKLATWQLGDISANPAYGRDFHKALGAITARAILIPCSDDLYFPPEDNEIEARHMPNAQFRPYASPWGHCVANPGNDPEFERFLDEAIVELIAD